MELTNMFYDQIEDAVQRKVPFIIPIGTIEYHAYHASCGTDTMVITGCLRELEKEKEIVICPPIWYGVASKAVCGMRPGHVHVDEDAYASYLYCVVKSFIEAGVKNLYLIPHHQTANAGLRPMTIACHKAAQKAIMEHLESTIGDGWWGNGENTNYYSIMGTSEDPLSYVKVIPLIGAEAQKKCGGFDHAGKWETSLMMGTWPENVDLSRCEKNTDWFAESAKEASAEIGHHMVACTLEWLRTVIQ